MQFIVFRFIYDLDETHELWIIIRAMAATTQALSSRVDDSARMKKIWPQGPPSQTTESLTMFGQTMSEFVRIKLKK